MTGIAPLFSTAPRIRLKINGTTIAYAVGLNINVSVDIRPVPILGKFGPVSLEPTLYNTVTGTLQIIRLVSKEDLQSAIDTIQDPANSSVFDNQVVPTVSTQVDDGNGNTTEQQVPAAEASTAGIDSNNPLSQNNIIRHMDPRSVLLSRTFDMALFMRVPNVADANVAAALDADPNNDPAPGDIDVNSENAADSGLIEVPWMTVKNTRLSTRNVNISIGQLVNEPVSFQGLFLTPHDEAGDEMFGFDQGPSVGS